MQAQVPHNPYTGLWSRLDGFRPESLSELLERREVVRVGVMRGTIHLVTGDDCLLLRPLVQPVFEAQLRRHPEHGAALREVDLTPVVDVRAGTPRGEAAERDRAARDLRGAVPGSRPGCPRARLPDAARLRAGAPARALGPERTGEIDDGGVVARQAVRRRSIDRLGRAALPRGVRPGLGRRRDDVVPSDRDARGRRAATASARHLPGRARPRALRPAGRPASLRRRRLRRCASCPSTTTSLLSHDDRSRFFDEADRAALGAGLDDRLGFGAARRRRRRRLAAGAGGAGRPPRRPAAEERARRDRRGGPAACAVPRGRSVRACGWSPLSP